MTRRISFSSSRQRKIVRRLIQARSDSSTTSFQSRYVSASIDKIDDNFDKVYNLITDLDDHFSDDQTVHIMLVGLQVALARIQTDIKTVKVATEHMQKSARYAEVSVAKVDAAVMKID